MLLLIVKMEHKKTHWIEQEFLKFSENIHHLESGLIQSHRERRQSNWVKGVRRQMGERGRTKSWGRERLVNRQTDR